MVKINFPLIKPPTSEKNVKEKFNPLGIFSLIFICKGTKVSLTYCINNELLWVYNGGI